VVVVGGGPAGISAAIQSSRFGLDTVMIERNEVGGQLRTANLVENYPGFPDGIPGRDLVTRMREQLEGHPVEIATGDVTKVATGPSVVILGKDDPLQAKSVIVCTGLEPIRIACPIAPSITHIIDYDIDDTKDWHGKRVAIVGGGEAAFDRAINLRGGIIAWARHGFEIEPGRPD